MRHHNLNFLVVHTFNHLWGECICQSWCVTLFFHEIILRPNWEALHKRPNPSTFHVLFEAVDWSRQLSVNMVPVGLINGTGVHHQGAIDTFWLHFWGALSGSGGLKAEVLALAEGLMLQFSEVQSFRSITFSCKWWMNWTTTTQWFCRCYSWSL